MTREKRASSISSYTSFSLHSLLTFSLLVSLSFSVNDVAALVQKLPHVPEIRPDELLETAENEGTELVVVVVYRKKEEASEELLQTFNKASPLISDWLKKNSAVDIGLIDEMFKIYKMNGKLSCNKAFLDAFEVVEFPTVLVFKEKHEKLKQCWPQDDKTAESESEFQPLIENRVKFEGPIDAPEKVSTYLRKLLSVSVLDFSNVDRAIQVTHSSFATVVGLFHSLSPTSPSFLSLCTFLKVIEGMRSDKNSWFFSYALATKPELLPQVGSEVEPNSVRVYKQFDQGFEDWKMPSPLSPSLLSSFLRKATTPIVVPMVPEMNDRVQEALRREDTSKAWLVFDPAPFIPRDPSSPSLDSSIPPPDFSLEDLLDVVYEVAREKEGEFSFISVNAREEGNDFAKSFLSMQDQLPLLMTIERVSQKKYIKNNVRPEDVREFIEGIESKTLKPFIKSETIPEEGEEGKFAGGAERMGERARDAFKGQSIRTVVHDNFWSSLFHTKDVFVLFSSSRTFLCPKCPSADEVLAEEVREEFEQDGDKLQIARMDLDKNDIPLEAQEQGLFNVQKLPAMYFISGKTHDVEKFEGDVEDSFAISNFIWKERGKERKRKSEDEGSASRQEL